MPNTPERGSYIFVQTSAEFWRYINAEWWSDSVPLEARTCGFLLEKGVPLSPVFGGGGQMQLRLGYKLTVEDVPSLHGIKYTWEKVTCLTPCTT
ncbi:hypothetical protein [Maridesulfovibrio sp.]|uniref:hypothetical protein n=1 Tax=Maridesulfovibrio sp. TaxID=2795000 RepID=UPI0029C9ED54|nr:hypothetical protein [Maridesulfovibrio sp.]